MLSERHLTLAATIAGWLMGSYLSAELFGYFLHRLLHSGLVPFLSRNHMKHHLVLYGPLQQQQSKSYHDATLESISLGNIGLEWLAPSAALLACALGVFRWFRVPAFYQLLYVAATLGWSFLMFSYLHDVMHIEGYWLEHSPLLRGWFTTARKRHEIHHRTLSDGGLMNKNFGIGFFFFDRLFGTLRSEETDFNRKGYNVAREWFKTT